MQVSMIFASDQLHGIGLSGKLSWNNIPEDMEWFKQNTLGKIVIMGRVTFESLPERFRPLPGRTNVVLSSNPIEPPGVIVLSSVQEVLEQFKYTDEIVIIGGAEVYKSFAPYITKVYQTSIPGKHKSDLTMEVYCDEWDMVYHDARLGGDKPVFQIFEKMGFNNSLYIEIEKILPL